MDRFAWTDGLLAPEEQLVVQQNGVRLYDGDDKTSFDHGKLILTTHRLLWRAYKDQQCVICMALSYVILMEEQSAGFHKSPKIVLHLSATPAYKPPGPVSKSKHSHVRLSFKEGGETEFHRCLSDELSRKAWERTAPQPVEAGAAAATGVLPGKKQMRTGIGGIERNIQQKHKDTDKSISQAFQDLSKLMDKAKEMVTLSKNITQKIKDKQGDITEDETVRFKSYLLSLGISDPVTRETHGTGDKYFRELARQVSSAMEQPLQECGGTMTLSDTYCRINRARGMELLSPEDLVNACKLLDAMKMPVRLRVFESGVMVLQLQSHSEEESIRDTDKLVTEKGSLTGDEMAKVVGLSVVLSKERLLAAEKAGKVCRDETAEGLRFYPNLFLTKCGS